jgi:hypothetical protein
MVKQPLLDLLHIHHHLLIGLHEMQAIPVVAGVHEAKVEKTYAVVQLLSHSQPLSLGLPDWIRMKKKERMHQDGVK